MLRAMSIMFVTFESATPKDTATRIAPVITMANLVSG